MRGFLFLIAGLLLACLTSMPAMGNSSVSLSSDGCSQIELYAENAELGEVLEALADEMGFRLFSSVPLNTITNIEHEASLQALLDVFLHDMSTTVMHQRRPDCDDGSVVSAIWIHAKGQHLTARDTESERGSGRNRVDAPLQRDPSASPRAHPPRGLRRSLSEEEWQAVKEAYAAGEIAGDPETGEMITMPEYQHRKRQLDEDKER